MGIHIQYAYHSGSKFLYTDFRAGEPSDSLNDFIERENWSEYELYVSNVLSYPRDKHGLLKPVADYVIIVIFLMTIIALTITPASIIRNYQIMLMFLF